MLKFLLKGTTIALIMAFPLLAAEKDDSVQDAPLNITQSTSVPVINPPLEDETAATPPRKKKSRKKGKEIVADIVKDEAEGEEPKEHIQGESDTPSTPSRRELLEPIETPSPANPPLSQESTPRRDKKGSTDEIQIPIYDTYDVEAAQCTGSCLKNARGFWGVTSGWFDLINTFASTAKPFITTLATVSYLPENIKRDLGITSTILNGLSIAAAKLADSGAKNAIKTQKELAELQEEIDDLLQANHPTDTKLKASLNAVLSDEDQERYIKLRTQIADLTALSGCEKKYFRFASCFWSSTSTVSDILGLICKAGSLVMVPLTTIPHWDTHTNNILNFVTLSLEAGSLFFDQLSQNAKKVEAERAQLREALEKIKVS